MVMPGMLDPAQVAEMQKVSQHIRCTVRVDYKEKTITLKLSTTHQEAEKVMDNLINMYPELLAQQLSSFFAVRGEIIEVNKPQ